MFNFYTSAMFCIKETDRIRLSVSWVLNILIIKLPNCPVHRFTHIIYVIVAKIFHKLILKRKLDSHRFAGRILHWKFSLWSLAETVNLNKLFRSSFISYIGNICIWTKLYLGNKRLQMDLSLRVYAQFQYYVLWVLNFEFFFFLPGIFQKSIPILPSESRVTFYI